LTNFPLEREANDVRPVWRTQRYHVPAGIFAHAAQRNCRGGRLLFDIEQPVA